MLFACALVEDAEGKQRRIRLQSSRSNSRDVPDSPLSPRPVMEQEPSGSKERFVPPELSIWDYFMAKVSICFVLGEFVFVHFVR